MIDEAYRLGTEILGRLADDHGRPGHTGILLLPGGIGPRAKEHRRNMWYTHCTSPSRPWIVLTENSDGTDDLEIDLLGRRLTADGAEQCDYCFTEFLDATATHPRGRRADSAEWLICSDFIRMTQVPREHLVNLLRAIFQMPMSVTLANGHTVECGTAVVDDNGNVVPDAPPYWRLEWPYKECLLARAFRTGILELRGRARRTFQQLEEAHRKKCARLGRPYIAITYAPSEESAELRIELPPTRAFTGDAVATIRSLSRRPRDQFCGDGQAIIRRVPADRVHDLSREILELPQREVRGDGAETIRNAPPPPPMPPTLSTPSPPPPPRRRPLPRQHSWYAQQSKAYKET